MSTIKSSAENLTLNADGANNDIKFQSNGSEVASIDQAGNLTVSGTVDGVDIQTLNTTVNSKAPIANPTFTGTVASIISANNAQGEIAFGDPEDANIGRIAYNHPSNFLATVVNATEYMRIHSNGVTSIPAGVALGVAVSANTASNVLDDYEEGTWTPVLGTGGNHNSRSGTWSNTIGLYTKIGNTVHLYIGITGSAMYFTSTRGYQYITGVPFAAANPTHYNTYAGTWGGDSVDKSSSGRMYLNSTSIYMHSANSNPDTAGVAGIGCHITYRTNS